MTALFAPEVLGTAEARRKLPSILARFRSEGETAEPVFIGAHHRPEAVVLPAALLARLAPLIEELLHADTVRERLENDDGERHTTAQVSAAIGVNQAQVDADAEALAAELGL